MAKPRGKKNETSEAGPGASDMPNSNTLETEDKSDDDIAALSAEGNWIKSDVCATIENRITEVSANIRDEISSLNQNIHKSISELKNSFTWPHSDRLRNAPQITLIHLYILDHSESLNSRDRTTG